jgi:tRNA(Glu) U13 pseudouridine synthase TruD
MPSPKYVKKDYAIIREDNTFVVYTLTKSDYTKLGESLACDAKFVELSVGFLGLKDVRAVIKQKPETKKVEKEKPKQPDSGYPEMDAVSLAWLKQQEKELAEWNDKYGAIDDLDKDSDLDGGRFS